jgi:putative peptide zinc metalloprotease protein
VTSGDTQQVFFQLALAAYLGAFFNLNPFLDRDGYNILVDVLREPSLRERARRQLAQKLSGAATSGPDSPILMRYAIAGVIWSALGAGLVIVFATSHYRQHVSSGLVLAGFILCCIVLFIPVLVQLGWPLILRARFGPAAVNRVIR